MKHLIVYSFLFFSSCTTCLKYDDNPTYTTSNPTREYKQCIQKVYSPKKTTMSIIVGFLSFITLVNVVK